jgi:hypothetical protein
MSELRHLELLRDSPRTHQDFFFKFENDVVNFLIRFNNYYSDYRYTSLVKGLYRKLWYNRLAQYGKRKQLESMTFDELAYARRLFNRWFDLIKEVPCLMEVIGDPWYRRYKAIEKQLGARMAQKRSRPVETVKLLVEAAKELDQISKPNDLDRANIERLRARAEETLAFRCLRMRPVPDLQQALIKFGVALKYARRGQKFRTTVPQIAPDYVWYLRYWLHLVAFQILCVKKRFWAAQRHIDSAVNCVSKLHHFPQQKWYVSLEDIRNQKIIINAYEAFVGEQDLAKTSELLQEWLERSKTIQTTGRYERLFLRKLAVDCLLAWKKGKDAAKNKTARDIARDLQQLLERKRQFGRGELYIQGVLKALLEGIIDFRTAINQIGSVFVLDTTAPIGFEYVDQRSPEEKSFRLLPRFFWAWLFETEKPENEVVEKAMYIFLLYVRCVAEFWSSVYQKQYNDSVVEIPLGCNIPENYAFTNWNDLLTILTHLAVIYKDEPKLSELCDSIYKLQKMLVPRMQSRGQTTDTTGLRDIIVQQILDTERNLFPHPVLLEAYEGRERGRIWCRLKRFWHALPEHFEVTFLPRRDQELVVGSYYFLKPSFKRSAREEDHEDMVLYPLHPSSCFGVPAQRSIILLVEGSNDISIFKVLLNHLNPHWAVRVQLEEAGGAAYLVRRYRDFRKEHRNIVTVADIVGTAEKDIIEIKKTCQYLFLMSPDFEGAQPEALSLALNEIAPDLYLTCEEVAKLISHGQGEVATLECIKKYQRERDFNLHLIFTDMSELKRSLTIPLAHKLIDTGMTAQVLNPLAAALSLGFGHS